MSENNFYPRAQKEKKREETPRAEVEVGSGFPTRQTPQIGQRKASSPDEGEGDAGASERERRLRTAELAEAAVAVGSTVKVANSRRTRQSMPYFAQSALARRFGARRPLKSIGDFPFDKIFTNFPFSSPVSADGEKSSTGR